MTPAKNKKKTRAGSIQTPSRYTKSPTIPGPLLSVVGATRTKNNKPAPQPFIIRKTKRLTTIEWLLGTSKGNPFSPREHHKFEEFFFGSSEQCAAIKQQINPGLASIADRAGKKHERKLLDLKEMLRIPRDSALVMEINKKGKKEVDSFTYFFIYTTHIRRKMRERKLLPSQRADNSPERSEETNSPKRIKLISKLKSISPINKAKLGDYDNSSRFR